MAFVIGFNVLGDQQMSRKLSRFAENLTDASEAFEEIYVDFVQGEAMQFDSEGGYGGVVWPALSKDYAKWKARNFPGQPILQSTGLMRESLLGENPWAVKEIEPLRAVFGTSVSYAKYHQGGTRKMARRPVIQLPEEQKTRWHKIFHGWVVNKAKDEGLL